MWLSLRACTLGLACVGLVSAVGAQSLTSVEETLAVQLADPSGAIQSAAMLHPDATQARGTANRVVVSRVEAVRNDAGRRLAVVTLYQYEGNITTDRLVDLDSNAIINERSSRGVGTPVAEVELEYARTLLLSDERIRQLVEPFQGNIDIGLVPTMITDPANPLFGKRVATVTINTPQGYVTGIHITVNLTDATVNVQQ